MMSKWYSIMLRIVILGGKGGPPPLWGLSLVEAWGSEGRFIHPLGTDLSGKGKRGKGKEGIVWVAS